MCYRGKKKYRLLCHLQPSIGVSEKLFEPASFLNPSNSLDAIAKSIDGGCTLEDLEQPQKARESA